MAQQTDHVPDVRKMVTAVQYLKEIYDSCNEYEEFISKEDFEMALKMEKEQIIKAIEDWYTFDFKSAEQYYNETYGK